MKKLYIIRREEAEKGFKETDSIRYLLPEGSTLSYVVNGRVGPKKDPPHKHEQEEYWFIIEGTAKAMIGSEEVDLFPGDLVIIPAGISHTVWSETGGMSELAFMIQTGKPDARAKEVESRRMKNLEAKETEEGI
jgi:mannose-6-phosphate isomerase-like protein (cupin superfamily)